MNDTDNQKGVVVPQRIYTGISIRLPELNEEKLDDPIDFRINGVLGVNLKCAKEWQMEGLDDAKIQYLFFKKSQVTLRILVRILLSHSTSSSRKND